jgi:hypothetical protein
MNTWQEDLDIGTIWRSFNRDPRIKARERHPMEDKWLQVTNEHPMEHFHELLEVVSGVPADFVFDIGEMGHQNWADKQIKT